MLTNGGVHGVRASVVDAVVCEKSDETEVRWDGVSSLNNFNTQMIKLLCVARTTFG